MNITKKVFERMDEVLGNEVERLIDGPPDLVLPKIIVLSDYDGYFKGLVEVWVGKKTSPFNHRVISITSGPYRSAAVTFRKDGDILHLDFYSAIRSGFGSLTSQDVEELIKIL